MKSSKQTKNMTDSLADSTQKLSQNKKWEKTPLNYEKQKKKTETKTLIFLIDWYDISFLKSKISSIYPNQKYQIEISPKLKSIFKAS